MFIPFPLMNFLWWIFKIYFILCDNIHMWSKRTNKGIKQTILEYKRPYCEHFPTSKLCCEADSSVGEEVYMI